MVSVRVENRFNVHFEDNGMVVIVCLYTPIDLLRYNLLNTFNLLMRSVCKL